MKKKNSNDTLKCFCHAVKSVILIFFFLFDFFFPFPEFFSFFLFVTDVLLAVEPWLWCGKLRFANCSVALFFGFFGGRGKRQKLH